MTTERTICPMDCPDTCALHVTVNEKQVTTIRAATNDGTTSGFICSKVAGFGARLTHPERLTKPLRRIGAKGEGRFEPISWDQAVDHITQRFQKIRDEFGGEAILPFHYGGSNGLLTDGFMDRLFFARLGASRLDKTICAVPTTQVAVGMYGKMPGVAFEDYVHAKCIVVWGANPKASSIHHVPYLKEAKRRGAFVVAIDPRRNFSHREIDLHLPVQPGTDVVLALALSRWWLEHGFWAEQFLAEQAINVEKLRERAQGWSLDEASRVTGVKASDIELLARRFGESEPAVVRCGWGPERNQNGGQAIAAILAIPALLGKFGVRGGGYTMSNSGATRSDMDSVVGPVEWTARSVNMSRLGTALLELNDPPIKGLFVYNANPVATVPNQNLVLNGLQREDLFTVVFEQVMTDTAVYADIVLPATTFLEHHDIRVSYGTYGLGGVRPVVGAVGEARPNAEVFATLGRAMGFDDEAFHWDPNEYMTRVSKHVRVSGDSADTERLMRGEMQRCDFPGPTPVQFESVFPRTQDGKINLTPDVLGPNPYEYSPPTDDLPLALVTPASSRLISSTFGESNLSTLEVTVHPADAVQRGIRDRDLVRVHNAFGEVHCRLRISERIRPGVVAMAKGAWRKASHNGFTSTALCPDHVNVVGGAACFNDARVEVTALQRS